MSDPSPHIHLVTGDDAVLTADGAAKLVAELLGGADRDLALHEIGEAQFLAGGSVDLAPLVDAAQTPPLFTDYRVVVGRELACANTAALEPLLRYLDAPLPTTRLVLVWEKGPATTRLGAVPKKLREAVKSRGQIHSTSVGRGKGASTWFEAQFSAALVILDRAARRRIVEWAGEDASRVPALLRALDTAHGEGASVGEDELTPFLGEAGGVPPWELTDRIAAGDIAGSLGVAHRMMTGGDRHPLVLLSTLHRHYGQLLRLDGSDASTEKKAAVVLGLKGSTFPARKALKQLDSLGRTRVRRAIELLAAADLDLRGESALDGEVVIEVLVARLAALH